MKTTMKKHTAVMLAALVALSAFTATAATSPAPTASTTARRKPAPRPMSGVINLNTASLSQLDALPGVGPKAAERIVVFRQKTPFTRIEELVKVKGFGKKKFDKLKAHLAVNGQTTLKVGKPGEVLADASSSSGAPAQGRSPPPLSR